MIFSDLAAPIAALTQNDEPRQGFAKAENRYPLLQIML
jgi:hypothetical protein